MCDSQSAERRGLPRRPTRGPEELAVGRDCEKQTVLPSTSWQPCLTAVRAVVKRQAVFLQASLEPGPISCIWPGVGRMDRYPGVALARRQSRWALVGLHCRRKLGAVQVARRCLSGAHRAVSWPGCARPRKGELLFLFRPCPPRLSCRFFPVFSECPINPLLLPFQWQDPV